MKSCVYARSLSFALILASLALTGCGMGSSSFGVVGTMPVTESSPPLEGSVFGGHAPLVGARVYILKPSILGNPNLGQTGPSLSVMNTANTGGTGYTPILDTIDGSPGNGMYYVVTDGSGGYNLTGDYTCTQNDPIYLAAVGGTPTYSAPTATVSISAVAIGARINGSTSRTYTYSTSTASGYTIGQYVAVTGFLGTSAVYNRTGFVTAETNASFSILATYTAGPGTYTGTPVGTVYPGWNPSAINMTALGLCPSSTAGVGFKNALSYIFTNEVSSAAVAMAMGAFGTDAFDIGVQTGGDVDTHYGTAGYDLNGLRQAMNNASMLYDIQGGNTSTTFNGEGHIARAVTPSGNGILPQALMDTLGNILAACVDSGNTGTVTGVSTQCNALFNNATTTGKTCTAGTGGGAPHGCAGGTTAPTDTATAAFNIAHHPAGDPGNTSFVSTLYGLPSGVAPFSPNLSTAAGGGYVPVSHFVGQPNDFSVTIAFAAPQSVGSTTNLINQPQAIKIDGGNWTGNEYGYTGETNGEYEEGVWIANFGGQVVKLFANGGAPDYTVNSALAATTVGSRSVTIDANIPGNVWMAVPSTAIYEWSIAGTAISTYTPPANQNDALNYPLDVVLDGAGTTYNLYVPQYGNSNLLRVTSAGVNKDFNGNRVVTGTNAFSTTQPCLNNAATATFDGAGNLYTYGETSGYVCVIDQTSGQSDRNRTGYTTNINSFGPAFLSADGNASVWAGNATNNTLIRLTNGGAQTTFTGGGLNEPCSTAVDGAGNIWVGNAGVYGVSEFSGAGTAMSPPAQSSTYLGGYSPQYNNEYTLNGVSVFNLYGQSASNCATPAIDRAGNVWMAYQGTSSTTVPGTVFEILGIAAPTVTPLSYNTFGDGGGYLGEPPY